MMFEGPFPLKGRGLHGREDPKGKLMSSRMIDQVVIVRGGSFVKEDVLKLEIGEASPIYFHEGKEFCFVRFE